MNAPEPYKNGTHLVVRGHTVTVTDHAPNADSWRYTGAPSDLAGGDVHFSHEEAFPIERPMPLPPTARNLMASAGLDLEVFDREHTPLGDLVETVASLVRRGLAPPELYAAYRTYFEATA